MELIMNEKEFLEDYKKNEVSKYPKPSVTADVCICRFDENKLKVLLIKRGGHPFKDCWAIPGGFSNPNESVDETALRELQEETNISGIPVHQLATYSDPNRDPRHWVITVAYFALVSPELLEKQDIKALDDAKEYAWFDILNLPENLAFDHEKILSDLKTRIRNGIDYRPFAFDLVNKKFTWSELQAVYETITEDRKYPASFRTKIKSMYQIKQTGEFKPTASNKAELLEFEK